MTITQKLENSILKLIYKTTIDEFDRQEISNMQNEFNRHECKIIKFQFLGSRAKPTYFQVRDGKFLIIKDPEQYNTELSTTLRTLLNVGRGVIPLKYAIRKQIVRVDGERYLGDSIDFEKIFNRVFERIKPTLLKGLPLKVKGGQQNPANS